jgi:general secretion pathway protein E/type IV pilus assembly protein PilB
LLNCDIYSVAAAQKVIDDFIEKHYTITTDSVENFIDKFADESSEIEQMQPNNGLLGAADVVGENDGPIEKLISLIILNAHKKKASDIHLEPLEKRYRIRYRIDGVLFEEDAPPKYLQNNLTQRIKVMAKLDISEKRIPQDGRINLKFGKNEIDLRVSSIPTTHGESIVMRILDKSSIQLDIPELGFWDDDLELVKKIISYPDGIFLVTGPTGSGKTTSLYAFLNSLNTPGHKIITVEDPIEYQLAGINQVQANRATGMTFALALRAMLRQAPNIIMVGEVRDYETAEIAINAALTGHLVFTTLHTNDAPGAITRLTDMGVSPFLLASGVRAVMAQRLVRCICKKCMVKAEPTGAEIVLLGLTEEYMAKNQFYRGAGCELCGRTGYKGRLGVYEILVVNSEISELVFKKESDNVLRDCAKRNGMRSLRDDALRKAAAGLTTLEEVVRLTVSE